MSWQIAGLVLVVTGFLLLTVWVYLPKNRKRIEKQGELVWDEHDRPSDHRNKGINT